MIVKEGCLKLEPCDDGNNECEDAVKRTASLPADIIVDIFSRMSVNGLILKTSSWRQRAATLVGLVFHHGAGVHRLGVMHRIEIWQSEIIRGRARCDLCRETPLA